MKVRKKPVEVNAIQWDGTNIDELRNSFPNFTENSWLVGKNPDLFIYTLEGNMHASIGDYIIMGVDGEFYACKPDKFKKTYDIIEEKEE